MVEALIDGQSSNISLLVNLPILLSTAFFTLVLGQSGMMNFEQIFKNFNANGHSTFFVEIEDTRSGKQMQRMKESADYLLAADFVK